MNTLGMDPGMSGGCALVGERLAAWAFKGLTEKDIYELLKCLVPEVERCYLEAVHSFPGQGVSSTFKFGEGYGGLRMALIAAEIPFEVVSPTKWKKAMGLVREKDMTLTAYKNLSKARAQELFPGVVVTHATAEALLLAEYGRRQRI